MRWLRIVVGVFLCAAPVACDAGGEGDGVLRRPIGRPTETESLIIGLVGTMTGPGSWRGEDAFEGADLAVHELNTSVTTGPPFRLLSQDDRGDPEEAVRLIEDLAELDDLVGIVYAGPPEALPRAEDRLAARGVPAMVVYGDLYSARSLTAHIFQMSPPLLWQARRMVSYIRRDRGYERYGVLAPDTPEWSTAVRSVRVAAALRGGRDPKVARFDPVDPTPALDDLRAAGTEAVIVAGDPAQIGSVVEAIEAMGARYASTAAARIASAPKGRRAARRSRGWWKPQVLLFDLAFSPRFEASPPPGTVVSETYGRGVHYLPVPSFQRFRIAFREWWGGERPLGAQVRGYDAVKVIGWAVERSGANSDIAEVLEHLTSERFGSLDITFGPDDHTAVDPATVGLWVVPRPDAAVRERNRLPERLPWAPLARGFSIDGETLDILSEDWAYLVRDAPPATAPAPRIGRLRFGVRSGRADPVH